MTAESRYWTSGNWQVINGKADEFIDRWTEFLRWTKEANEGFLSARLIRQLDDPNRFVSFASWRDVESLSAWRQKPEFAQRLGRCRTLCADMQGGNYQSVCEI